MSCEIVRTAFSEVLLKPYQIALSISFVDEVACVVLADIV